MKKLLLITLFCGNICAMPFTTKTVLDVYTNTFGKAWAGKPSPVQPPKLPVVIVLKK